MQKDKFIQDLSDCFNNNNTYKIIRDCAVAHLDIDLENDDEVWHDIEEAILEVIINFKENKQ